MKEQLEAIRKGALEAIAAAQETAGLEALRVKYLGKKGELTAVLKQMGGLSAELRPVMGQQWASWPTTSGPAWKPLLSASPASSPKRLWKPGWRRRPWT